MTNGIKTISPVDGSVLVEREYADEKQISQALENSRAVTKSWSTTLLEERAKICESALQYFEANKSEIAIEITRQMGRPIAYTQGEIAGLAERGRYMIGVAQQSLADIVVEDTVIEDVDSEAGQKRFIRKQALGLVFIIAPWNYPYLTAINSIIPALMAGNTVLLKHSGQTPLCAERFYQAFQHAGLPEGVFQYLHLPHQSTSDIIQHPDVKFIAFTGSVQGGSQVEKSAAGKFKGVGLELGGKDPAYVRADADLNFTVENLVDGAFFNSGQSCCGVERIYVHESLYESFVEQFVALVKQYRLGDPLDKETTLGPLVNIKSADFVREQIEAAVKAGAKTCLADENFKGNSETLPENYLFPQVLVDVNHDMSVMTEESFGPVVGIMPVKSDGEALALMNDSEFGLTASIWTKDMDVAEKLGAQIETGTVYMNRCDYLDPALVWTGVKNTGRGYSLSSLAYGQLTQAKSFYLRK